MKRISSTLIFCGVVLIVGPFLGFTIRGQEDVDYASGAILGLIAIVIGVAIKKVFRR